MKAFVVDKYKKKGALILVNMPEPDLQDNDVLIRICVTAVNQLGGLLWHLGNRESVERFVQGAPLTEVD